MKRTYKKIATFAIGTLLTTTVFCADETKKLSNSEFKEKVENTFYYPCLPKKVESISLKELDATTVMVVTEKGRKIESFNNKKLWDFQINRFCISQRGALMFTRDKDVIAINGKSILDYCEIYGLDNKQCFF